MSGFAFITLISLLISIENIDTPHKIVMIIATVITGPLTCILLWISLTSIINLKIILRDDSIQIQTFYILSCLNKNEIYNYIDIKSFQVEIKSTTDSEGDTHKHIDIIYLDTFNQKKYLFSNGFDLEEAEYLVYVANDFINKRLNMIIIS